MDLSALWAECGRLLGDPSHDRWSTDVLTARANIAQNEINISTRALKQTGTASLVAGSTTVSIGATPADIIKVTIQRPNGDVVELAGISPEDLDFHYPNWRQWEDGDPILYYPDISAAQINVVPPPSVEAAAVSNPLSITSVRRFGTELSASTDIPFAGFTSLYPYHMTIVHWVVSQCWMDDGTPEAMGKAIFHKSGNIERPGQYELQIKNLLQTLDKPTDVDYRVLWKPEGGRTGTWGVSRKQNPLSY